MATPTQVARRYQLERRLGAGGMSTVFLAVDSVLERPVAVKLLAEHLAEDEDFVARFRREALAAARLQHPNIVQVFDSGEDPETGRHYIVMEYVEGPSCADLLRDDGRLDVDRSAGILIDASRGLDYAHRAGVVHRDVKPGNLLVFAETGNVKLADFGIAKAAEQTRMTQVGSVLGTAAYLSPEQARGDEAGPASDIYSLGVCGYQFLSGRLPHEYSSLTELALKQERDRVQPLTELVDDVPVELDRAIRVCLERDPNARYGSALEMAEAIEAGLNGEDTAATLALAGGATEAMPREGTAATRAMRAGDGGTRVAPAPRRPPPATGRRPTASGRPAPAARRCDLGRILGALLVIALIALALLILASSGDGGGRPIVEDNVRDQVRGMQDYIQRHRER